MQSLNGGRFGAFVSLLSGGGSTRPPVVGPTVQLAVADRKTLNSGGILRLAFGVPAVLGLGLVGMRFARGRSA
jgi:hypothetical protein